MEPTQETCKACKFEPEDFISSMPDNVVTDIMDRLPLKDAVRTCILSRKWRCKWNMLSQLVFDGNFFDCFKDAKGKTDIGRIISRILLHIRGAITKFVLSIEYACYSVIVEEEISHWVVFLSIKGMKDLTLESTFGKPLKLPAHLFSCLELKSLKLVNCCFDPPASFQGFPNLLTLDLYDVDLENRKIVKLFTLCPILENLNMSHSYGNSISKVKLAEIAKLANLKRLSLLLCMVDKTSSSSILELVAFLPKLQKLHLDFLSNLQELRLDYLVCKITEEGVAAKRCLTTFPCLKTLILSNSDLSDGIGLSYALQMISSFPNLQTLEITSFTPRYGDATATPGICSQEADYNIMGLLQLRSVVLQDLETSENEVCFIKYLLACSPFLKKISIRLYPYLKLDEKFTLARKLLKYQRASPVVDIDLL